MKDGEGNLLTLFFGVVSQVINIIMRYYEINEAAWDTEKWWEPKLGLNDSGEHGVYSRYGVPEETVNRYSCGQCVWLALAMSQKYGWPIRAEMMQHEPTHIAHAYCVLPNGKEIDILGPQDKVDTFDGGIIKSFTQAELVNWLKENDRNAMSPDDFEDHLNDAKKAVELFIAPKVQGNALTEEIEYRGHTFPGYNKPIRAPAGDTHKKMVLVKRGDRIKLVKFGLRGMEDYTQHGDEDRRKNYLARSAGIRNKKGELTKDDPFSANYWARRELW